VERERMCQEAAGHRRGGYEVQIGGPGGKRGLCQKAAGKTVTKDSGRALQCLL
jgi:hypothetical protein